MTAAQRQKLLKRLLPALVVLAAYFGFIGPKINAKASAVAEEATRLKGNFISSQATLSQLEQQKRALLDELAGLRQESGKVDGEIVRDIGFLGAEDYASQAIARLSSVLTEHHLHIIEDGRIDWGAAKESLPASVSELGAPAKAKASGPGASLWRVRFSGAYPDVYHALDTLAHDSVVIIPVSLDMSQPEGDGELQWTLQIWI